MKPLSIILLLSVLGCHGNRTPILFKNGDTALSFTDSSIYQHEGTASHGWNDSAGFHCTIWNNAHTDTIYYFEPKKNSQMKHVPLILFFLTLYIFVYDHYLMEDKASKIEVQRDQLFKEKQELYELMTDIKDSLNAHTPGIYLEVMEMHSSDGVRYATWIQHPGINRRLNYSGYVGIINAGGNDTTIYLETHGSDVVRYVPLTQHLVITGTAGHLDSGACSHWIKRVKN